MRHLSVFFFFFPRLKNRILGVCYLGYQELMGSLYCKVHRLLFLFEGGQSTLSCLGVKYFMVSHYRIAAWCKVVDTVISWSKIM